MGKWSCSLDPSVALYQLNTSVLCPGQPLFSMSEQTAVLTWEDAFTQRSEQLMVQAKLDDSKHLSSSGEQARTSLLEQSGGGYWWSREGIQRSLDKVISFPLSPPFPLLICTVPATPSSLMSSTEHPASVNVFYSKRCPFFICTPTKYLHSQASVHPPAAFTWHLPSFWEKGY